MKAVAAVFAGLSIASAALAQVPPLEVKGVRLGMTLAQAKAAMPSLRCGETTCSLSADGLAIEKPCQWKGNLEKMMACTDQRDAPLVYGPAKATSFEFTTVNGVIGGAFVVFPNSSEPALVDAMTVKYGKPSRSVIGQVQNGMGAAFESRETTWTFPAGSIRITQRAIDINTATVEMGTPEAAAKEARERADKTKASAAKL